MYCLDFTDILLPLTIFCLAPLFLFCSVLLPIPLEEAGMCSVLLINVCTYHTFPYHSCLMKFSRFIDALHIASQMVHFQGISEIGIFDIGQM